MILKIIKNGLTYEVSIAQLNVLIRVYDALEIETRHTLEAIETRHTLEAIETRLPTFQALYHELSARIEFCEWTNETLQRIATIIEDVSARPNIYNVEKRIAYAYDTHIEETKRARKLCNDELRAYYDVFLASLHSAKQETIKSFK